MRHTCVMQPHGHPKFISNLTRGVHYAVVNLTDISITIQSYVLVGLYSHYYVSLTLGLISLIPKVPEGLCSLMSGWDREIPNLCFAIQIAQKKLDTIRRKPDPSPTLLMEKDLQCVFAPDCFRKKGPLVPPAGSTKRCKR